MKSKQTLVTERTAYLQWSLLAWLAVGVFWLFTTRSYHPSWYLALTTTASLIVAYAAAAYVNHLVLIPRYLHQTRQPARYGASLLAVMVVFTALALAVLKWFYLPYLRTLPPERLRPLHIDFGIDLFGMAVHVLGAAIVVWVVKRVSSGTQKGPFEG